MKKILGIVVLGLLIFSDVNANSFGFSGTVWKMYDDDGDVKKIKFHKSGKCAYTNIRSASGNEGKSYSIATGGCRWTQIGDNKIRYDFNKNFMVRVAELTSSNFIAGTYTTKNRKGTFKFTGELISKKIQDPKIKEPKKSYPDDNKVVPAGSGSGFFVSMDGHIITNHHVVDGCNTTKVSFEGSQFKAKILAVDKVNDIAILKTNIKPDSIFSISNEDVSLLEDVVVAGYPLGKKVSSAIKTHKGVVTALAGAGDNYSNFQTDATINAGNSGGPIMNQKGNIVGVAVATWVEKDVQGVHFGIKSSTLKTFINSNSLKFIPANNRELSNKDLGKLITEATVYLECHMTVANIKKMMAAANNRKAFFSEFK
jgi:S1-C subfamily serine protease